MVRDQDDRGSGWSGIKIFRGQDRKVSRWSGIIIMIRGQDGRVDGEQVRKYR